MNSARKIICLGLLTIMVFCTGCPTIPILFLNTHVRGNVVDQFNRPVPHARLEATWRPHDLSLVHAKRYREQFEADENGRWEFRTRNAQDLCIEALSSEGYETISLSVGLLGPVRPGKYHIVRRPLRLRKIK